MRVQLSGLAVEVNADLPGFRPAETHDAVDVRVTLGDLGPGRDLVVPEPGTPWYASRRCDRSGTPELVIWELPNGHFWWRYCDGTEFLIDATGTEVHATWVPPLTLEDTVAYLIGGVVGFLLRLRRVICLHGSALVVGDRAVILTGPEEAGKSTTAAALALRGCPVLTDDIAALSDLGTSFLVQPGAPRIMLLPESVRALWASSGDQPPRLTPNWDKHTLDLTAPGQRYCRQPMPLGAIYFLGERDPALTTPRVEPLHGANALMQLVANSYANRLLDARMRAQEFALLTRVMRRVPVRQVQAPGDLTRLGDLCAGILEDCDRLGIGSRAVTT